MGMSDDGKTAFIAEGFDHKNCFGLFLVLPHDKQGIKFVGAPFSRNRDLSIDAKYHDTFTDITKASTFFAGLLKDYEIFCNTPIA